ncbi:hypothetical protein lacNasYZ03_11730 [Lactobacillus nasalidis]|uniref:Lj965 prophage protein n=1 Tax=Lactobacillus nasalidis TaxID=2797258 RepID=A0ABQ3W4M9_9LACO|nr:DUF6096 family protein [Lactobacillus nasalidis]GHV97897.1 hypothetical protein lacNasYZ01_10790 [Lactobacillus nasalidis]GHW00127.1 hypothetical protein lacNasYZ02_15560 [Lactobacillus nasalidis]GHW01486.1 hypothetical protein lacNasYZ03_11730 [Lactobacillus nasalidis]
MVKQGKSIQLGKLTLDCKLDGKAILAIEKRLHKSILSLFMDANGNAQLPPANELLIVLQGANKTHGVSDQDIISAFEDYIENGGTTVDLFSNVSDLLQESGFFGNKAKNTKTTSKSEPEMNLLDLDNEETDL